MTLIEQIRDAALGAERAGYINAHIPFRVALAAADALSAAEARLLEAREECAKVCDAVAKHEDSPYSSAAYDCADAIRALKT